VRHKETGIRKVNFKDYGQEPPGASTFGACWEGIPASVANHSIALGAGSLPTVWKGQGYRHLITAGQGAYERKYTIDKPAGVFWHTDQRESGMRSVHTYDFMFRVNTWPEQGAIDGVVFGYFIEHGGSPTFTESIGYRVRITGAKVILEKLDVVGGIAVWAKFQNATADWSEWDLVLDVDTDYYVRVSYTPTDIDYLNDKKYEVAGTHSIAIVDDFDLRGQGTVFMHGIKDPFPILGSADTKLMMGAYDGISAEFDCISYCNGFMEIPEWVHYKADSHIRSSSVLVSQWALPKQGRWEFLDEGDVIELWVKSRYTTLDVDPDTGDGSKIDDYWKTFCKFDGRVVKRSSVDRGKRVEILAVNEINYRMGSASDAIPVAGGTDYYAFMQNSLLAENLIASYQRATWDPGVTGAAYAQAVTAAWVHKGSMLELLRVINMINNGWSAWNPSGFFISQYNPIPTAVEIDLAACNGQFFYIDGVKRADAKRDSYANTVNVYSDDGAGGVQQNQVTSAPDVLEYGPSNREDIDINVPPAEGVLMATNIFNQQNQKEPILDVYLRGCGLDLYLGCKVGINDPSREVESLDYTVIEEEMWYSKDITDSRRSVYRIRISAQDDDAEVKVLPRSEMNASDYMRDFNSKGFYHDHYFT